ncbi:MAG: hypothetical protein NC419_09655, partial [Muribaculaceae bacterium]|nr:hypothetical protein [Muribaculaceae bacterium]
NVLSAFALCLKGGLDFLAGIGTIPYVHLRKKLAENSVLTKPVYRCKLKMSTKVDNTMEGAAWI